LTPVFSRRSRQVAAGQGIAGPRAAGPEGARREAATHALRRWRGAGRCAGRGGRCCAPTALCCSPRGRAAKLAALASRAPLGQSPRVRSTKRAARADPGAALLGAADIAPARPAPPPQGVRRRLAPRPFRPRGARPGDALARCHLPLWKPRRCSVWRRGRSLRALQRYRRRRGPLAAGAPVRSREAQRCRPAREARFVCL